MGRLRDAANKFDEALKNSCKEKIAEEKTLINKLKDISLNIQSSLETLNSITSNIESANKTLSDIQDRINLETAKLETKKIEFNILESATRIEIEKVKQQRDDIDNYSRKAAEDHALAKTALEAKQREVESLIKRDEGILESIRKEKEDFAQALSSHKKDIFDFKEIQSAFIEARDKFYIEKQTHESVIQNVTKKESDIKNDLLNIAKRSELLNEKENELKQLRYKLDDREIEINLRDAEISKLSRRVDNLIEIHKLNAKTV